MSKWIIKVSYGIHRKDGTFSGIQKSEKMFDEPSFETAKSFVENILLDDNDNIDDHGTCKPSIIGDEKEVWGVVRQLENGEFRGIYRLYEI